MRRDFIGLKLCADFTSLFLRPFYGTLKFVKYKGKARHYHETYFTKHEALWVGDCKESRKIYEYRKRFMHEEVEAYLYLSRPLSGISGVITMGKGIELDDLKKKYKNTSEVYSRICQYESRGNKMMMPILSICETNFISKGKIEIDIGRFIVPQGFYYLEGTELEGYLDENLVKNNAIKIDINRFQVADEICRNYKY